VNTPPHPRCPTMRYSTTHRPRRPRWTSRSRSGWSHTYIPHPIFNSVSGIVWAAGRTPLDCTTVSTHTPADNTIHVREPEVYFAISSPPRRAPAVLPVRRTPPGCHSWGGVGWPSDAEKVAADQAELHTIHRCSGHSVRGRRSRAVAGVDTGCPGRMP
jgi:hypothetical protein